MRFNRIALIERVDQLEAERYAVELHRHEQRTEAWNSALDRYREVDQPKLLAELRALVERCRKGRVITGRDLAELHGGDSHCFQTPRDPASRNSYGHLEEAPVLTYRPDPKLAATKALLEQISDEEVTTRDLKDLGLDPAVFINAAV